MVKSSQSVCKPLHCVFSQDLVKELSSRSKGKKGTWEVVESLQRPRIVHCRVFEIEEKKNYWVQITVRVEQKQVNIGGNVSPVADGGFFPGILSSLQTFV